jgi:hypothetical protein
MTASEYVSELLGRSISESEALEMLIESHRHLRSEQQEFRKIINMLRDKRKFLYRRLYKKLEGGQVAGFESLRPVPWS